MAKLLLAGNSSLTQEIAEFISRYQDIQTGNFRIQAFNSDPNCTLESKYYTASICLTLPPNHLNFEEQIDFINSTTNVEGFIFVVDPTKTREQLSLGEIAASKEYELRLLTFFKGGADETVLSYDDLLNWALDFGFELIEIDRSSIHEGWTQKEKEGLPRLIEALQSNMWSTMVKKTSSLNHSSSTSATTTSNSTIQPTSTSSTTTVSSISSSSSLSGEQALQESYRLIEETMREGEGRREAGQSDASTSLPIPPPSSSSSPSSTPPIAPTTSKKNTSPSLDSQLEEDIDLRAIDQFQDIIQQAKMYREQAVAQGANLTDQERRKRAEEVAMKLSMMMGLNLDDSDEDD